MRSFLFFLTLGVQACAQLTSPVVSTTSGSLAGVASDGLNVFKGVRFALPPTGLLRWEPPIPFISNATQNATTLAPSCLQQFAFASQAFVKAVFDNPGPASEAEDCLFLNVWAPANTTGGLKPVIVWIYGGSLAFGTASIPQYDGTSIASTQDVIVVSFNYRTNVFGFPSSPDLPLQGNNLGFLDQELAFLWVQVNIAAFGGDKSKVTIAGQSAGSASVAAAILRHTPADAPFRAGILFSGTAISTSPVPSFTSFDTFATGVGCTQPAGTARLACLRAVPALAIRNFTNGPASGTFGPVIDNVTMFADPLARIRSGLSARVPVVIGSTEDDGTAFAVGLTNLTATLQVGLGALAPPVDLVRSLYPGLTDPQIIADVIRDLEFRCPASLWSAALVGAGVLNVFQYVYGAVFADLQVFPNAGAWHSSEIPEFFGTFNASTATPTEVELSSTFQTALVNFVKNPTTPFADNWPRYLPGNGTTTLAKLAYSGNVAPDNFVAPVESDSLDGPCVVWDPFLDFRV